MMRVPHSVELTVASVIASHISSQAFHKAAAQDDRIRLIHFWKLTVNPDRSALLSAIPSSDERPFLQQQIPFTDFPLDKIDIWAGDNGNGFTLKLPSEY